MLELIQGEGGVLTLSADYVAEVLRVAREHDLLVIVDEVQTGNGRSGMLYAYMTAGLNPDIVSTAKGLGGGLPIGATLFNERTKDVLQSGDHGSTFGGNPVSCAGALSILNRIDDKLLEGVREKSAYIVGELTGAKGVISVSGLGLMLGVEVEKPAMEVANACLERGVLVLTAKKKLRLLPALNIGWDELKAAVSVLKEVIAG